MSSSVQRLSAPPTKTDDLLVIATACQEASEPGFRVRLAQPARALESHRIILELLPLFSPGQSKQFRSVGIMRKARIVASTRKRLVANLRKASPEASTVVIQRYLDMIPSLALEKEAVRGRRLIYDVDDAIWLTGRQTGGHPMAALKGTARKVRWLTERAEHVMAGNEILAEHLSTFSHRVTVVPSLVDPRSYALRTHEQADAVTLGWIGSPTTALYLRRIVPALERFGRRSPRTVRLVVVGGQAPRINGIRVEERMWSPSVEHQVLAETDIGLMPLDDTPWSRGKCAYKALQYMASGIPPVVDDVGISAEVVSGAGCVASSSDQWLEALCSLAEDSSLRARLGGVGRQRVESRFSLERWIPTIAGILRGD
jgi:glycosyltransferase involved in cell wall biosynthesis